ncbi:PadR family transcriptional regulator [Lentilactobacillus sp. TOM.63]|uniref:PadR family transcriptional regulator n=1 Tax=Lentilactobacillus TaxID=2767893 RepID=UPI001C27716A|nr:MULTISPECIES: PadR family transcriptional regulator [Lentilactobacillus]MBU9789503.1 PadR family transcriptional regulator [Lentilactobacillus dabitei]MDM7517164.1 PadR family transcriptional regulator [Lentilactobacillus sp. TOM.63]
MNPQLKKGFLEYCILAVLNKGDSYGYQIIKDVEATFPISESTLYPILKRLEKNEYITSHNEIYNNRVRRYYHLTSAGITRSKNFLANQNQIERIYQFVREAFENEQE